MEVCPFCGKAFKRLKTHLPHCKMAPAPTTTEHAQKKPTKSPKLPANTSPPSRAGKLSEVEEDRGAEKLKKSAGIEKERQKQDQRTSLSRTAQAKKSKISSGGNIDSPIPNHIETNHGDQSGKNSKKSKISSVSKVSSLNSNFIKINHGDQIAMDPKKYKIPSKGKVPSSNTNHRDINQSSMDPKKSKISSVGKVSSLNSNLIKINHGDQIAMDPKKYKIPSKGKVPSSNTDHKEINQIGIDLKKSKISESKVPSPNTNHLEINQSSMDPKRSKISSIGKVPSPNTNHLEINQSHMDQAQDKRHTALPKPSQSKHFPKNPTISEPSTPFFHVLPGSPQIDPSSMEGSQTQFTQPSTISSQDHPQKLLRKFQHDRESPLSHEIKPVEVEEGSDSSMSFIQVLSGRPKMDPFSMETRQTQITQPQASAPKTLQILRKPQHDHVTSLSHRTRNGEVEERIRSSKPFIQVLPENPQMESFLMEASQTQITQTPTPLMEDSPLKSLRNDNVTPLSHGIKLVEVGEDNKSSTLFTQDLHESFNIDASVEEIQTKVTEVSEPVTPEKQEPLIQPHDHEVVEGEVIESSRSFIQVFHEPQIDISTEASHTQITKPPTTDIQDLPPKPLRTPQWDHVTLSRGIKPVEVEEVLESSRPFTQVIFEPQIETSIKEIHNQVTELPEPVNSQKTEPLRPQHELVAPFCQSIKPVEVGKIVVSSTPFTRVLPGAPQPLNASVESLMVPSSHVLQGAVGAMLRVQEKNLILNEDLTGRASPMGLQWIPDLYTNYLQLRIVPENMNQSETGKAIMAGEMTSTDHRGHTLPERIIPEVPLPDRPLMEVRIGELPCWLSLQRLSVKRIPELGHRAWSCYYNKYLNVKKGGIGGLAMLLAGYCTLSYCWSYPHIRQERWRKYH